MGIIMTDDLMERIEGCIANADYKDEWETLIDARDRIEALTAEVERLNKSAECLAETRRLAVKDLAELEAEVERLLQIAQRLGTYSAHDDDCRIMTHGVWSDPIPCTCGYTDAWQAHLTAIRKQP
jgi:hypothetical protein